MEVLEDALATLERTDIHTLERLAGRFLAALSPDPDVADHICRLCDDRACPSVTCPVENAIAGQRPWACLLLFIDLNGGHWDPDPLDINNAVHTMLDVAARNVDEAWLAPGA